jgi:hypothetical protein
MVLTIIRGPIAVTIRLARVNSAIEIAIPLAFVRDPVPVAVILEKLAIVRNAVAVTVVTGELAIIRDLIPIAVVSRKLAFIRSVVDVTVVAGAATGKVGSGAHFAGAVSLVEADSPSTTATDIAPVILTVAVAVGNGAHGACVLADRRSLNDHGRAEDAECGHCKEGSGPLT